MYESTQCRQQIVSKALRNERGFCLFVFYPEMGRM